LKVSQNPAKAIRREAERLSMLPEIAKPGTDVDSDSGIGRTRLPPSLKASKDFSMHKSSQHDLLTAHSRHDYGGLREEK
jgi:hypothetical protein